MRWRARFGHGAFLLLERRYGAEDLSEADSLLGSGRLEAGRKHTGSVLRWRSAFLVRVP